MKKILKYILMITLCLCMYSIANAEIKYKGVIYPQNATNGYFLYYTTAGGLVNSPLSSDGVNVTNTGTFTSGTLTIGSGSITDSSGNITFVNENLVTTGTLGAGASTLGVITESGNAVPNATDGLDFFAATTSAELYGVLSDETGTGVAVFGTAPTFTTKITTPEVENTGAVVIDSTGAGVNVTTHSDATDDFTVNTTALVVEGDSGNVGIGTASPSFKLQVIQDPNAQAQIGGTSATTGEVLKIYRALVAASTDSPVFEVLQDSVGDDQPTARIQQDGTGDILQLFDGTTEVVSVIDGGNVGIGTASPSIGGAYAADVALTIDGGTSTALEDTAVLELGGSTTTNGYYTGMLAFYNADNSGAGGNTRKQLAIIRTHMVTSDANAGDDSGGDLVFYTKGEAGVIGEKARILSSGGITFNGDTATANALDDYEEGTWTPSVGGTATYHNQIGYYTKIGRQVIVNCWMQINVPGTGSTTTISGLPFTSLNGGYGSGVRCANLSISVVLIQTYVTGTNIAFSGMTSATTAITDNMAVLGTQTLVAFTIMYIVS